MTDSVRPAVVLSLLEETLAVCRLTAESPVPPAFTGGGPGGTGDALISITRTRDELSVVCPERMLQSGAMPPDAVIESGWRALGVMGPLDFSLIGILAALAQPLAAAKVSIFAISTYDTDYVLVREESLQTAIAALSEASHTVNQPVE